MKLFRFPRDKKEIENVLDRVELASLMVPFVTQKDVEAACALAVKYGFAGVLAIPDICLRTVKALKGTPVSPICVVSSNEIVDNDRATRLNIVRELLKAGVTDVDMGVSSGMALDGEFELITDEICDLAYCLHSAGGRLGVIIEPDQLPEALMDPLCDCAVNGGADFVRISSGMELLGAVNIGRATIHNVARAYERCRGKLRIKAGGGWDFSWLEDCSEYLESGASRVDAGPCLITQLEELGYER